MVRQNFRLLEETLEATIRKTRPVRSRCCTHQIKARKATPAIFDAGPRKRFVGPHRKRCFRQPTPSPSPRHQAYTVESRMTSGRWGHAGSCSSLRARIRAIAEQLRAHMSDRHGPMPPGHSSLVFDSATTSSVVISHICKETTDTLSQILL